MNKDENWWELPYVHTRDYLLTSYAELDITAEQLVVLLCMDLLKQSRGKLDLDELAKKTKLSNKKIQTIISELVEAGWLLTKVTTREVLYDFSPLFKKKQMVKLPKNIFDLFESQFKRPMTATELQLLNNFLQQYEKNYIEDALRKAVVYNKVNMKYIASILENWQREGKMLNESQQSSIKSE